MLRHLSAIADPRPVPVARAALVMRAADAIVPNEARHGRGLPVDFLGECPQSLVRDLPTGGEQYTQRLHAVGLTDAALCFDTAGPCWRSRRRRKSDPRRSVAPRRSEC